MALGAFAPLPLRLGGSDVEGWPSRMHARLAADLVALKRAAPLAIFTYTKVGAVHTVLGYLGQNGAGLAYAPDSFTDGGSGVSTIQWTARAFKDPYDVAYPINVRAAHATPTGGGLFGVVATAEVFANGVIVRAFDYLHAQADCQVTVVLY